MQPGWVCCTLSSEAAKFLWKPASSPGWAFPFGLSFLPRATGEGVTPVLISYVAHCGANGNTQSVTRPGRAVLRRATELFGEPQSRSVAHRVVRWATEDGYRPSWMNTNQAG